MSDTSKLIFKIKNNSGIDDKKVHIGFWGAKLKATINKDTMIANTWYPLSEINSLVIDVTTSGRVYVAYNDTFTPTGNSIPSILAPSSDGYDKRFDKFELTFDGTQYGVADLTSIDYWSIPMSLETELNGVKASTILNGFNAGVTGNDIYQALQGLSDPVESGKTATSLIKAFVGNSHSLPMGIQDALNKPNTGLIKDSNGDFVRIIGPNTYPPFGEPSKNQLPGLPFTPYNTFQPYITYLEKTFGPSNVSNQLSSLGNGKIAHIKGEFNGSSQGTGKLYQKQSYDLWASLDDNGDLAIEGAGSVAGEINLYVTKWDLLAPSSAYGGSPIFSQTKGGPKASLPNDIYAWIFGDFFAGLNIGAIGSTVKLNGKAVGDMDSSEWFSQLPEHDLLFDKLWTGNETNYWNQWAQKLNAMSDAYSFAYAERFSAPQISIDPAKADTLVLVLLDAKVSS